MPSKFIQTKLFLVDFVVMEIEGALKVVYIYFCIKKKSECKKDHVTS